MWPDRNEALSRTLHAERALEDLTAEALRQWAPTLRAAVLPSLAGQLAAAGAAFNGDPTAYQLPPDPGAVSSTAPVWDQIAADLIIVGLAVLWAAAFVEVSEAIGLPVSVPSEAAAGTVAAIPVAVLDIIDAAITGLSRTAIEDAARVVAATPALAAAREEYLDSRREAIEAIPGTVQVKIESALANRPMHSTSPREDVALARRTVEQAVEPSGPDMREIARTAGYQAAAVQNHAIVHAAEASIDPLDKFWIATLDGKTRPTHWAADGQRAPLSGKFTVGGEELRFPADPMGTPAEVANCRCRVGVLGVDEALPEEIDRHTERGPGDSTVVNRAGSQRDEINRRNARGNVRARDDAEGIGQVAAGGWTAPSEEIGTMTEALATDTSAETGDSYRTFTDAVIGFIGEPTSDGRMLAENCELSMRDFPLPLMWMRQTGNGMGGHTEAFTVGVLETATVNGSQITASGYLLNTAEADECADQVTHHVTNPSMDLAAVEWELTDENGKVISWDDWEPGDEVYQTMTKAELTGTTLVSVPAFANTSISLNAERETREAAVVASAEAEFRPRVYAASLFADPELSGPTLPTMDPETGRIYGHLACFGQCHRSIQRECVMAPRSPSDYAHFHTSPAVLLDDGNSMPVGRLTVGTGHANPKLSGGPALAHYDNTGTCFALVRIGEDEHGVWFSGVAHPQATPEQVEMGITAPLSGDWRDFGQGLDLIAALAVNTPGFAARGREDANGRPMVLVASLGPLPDSAGGLGTMTRDDIRTVVLEAMEESRRLGEHTARRNAALARATEELGPVPPPKSPNERAAEMLAAHGL